MIPSKKAMSRAIPPSTWDIAPEPRANQANPSADIDGYVAGDDADAKTRVLELVGSIGLNPLDVGPLSSARHLEGMAWINIGVNVANGWGWTSAWRLER